MRASEFINEETFGTHPSREGRPGRGKRGHTETPCYKNKDYEDQYEEEIELDEAGKTAKKVCLSKKTDRELGASQLSSCKAQGHRRRQTDRRFRISGKYKNIKGMYVKSADYGGPLPRWKGNE